MGVGPRNQHGLNPLSIACHRLSHVPLGGKNWECPAYLSYNPTCPTVPLSHCPTIQRKNRARIRYVEPCCITEYDYCLGAIESCPILLARTPYSGTTTEHIHPLADGQNRLAPITSVKGRVELDLARAE